MRTRWRVTTAAVMVSGLLTLTGAPPAFAQGRGGTEATKDMARERYKAAEAQFKSGNFSAAAELYRQAEDILPVPMTKYKLGVCKDRLGQTAEAIKWYQEFLAFNPPGKMVDQVAEVNARLATLKRATPAGPGQLRIQVSPPNAPRLVYVIDGGQPQYASPAIQLNPGHHRVVVQADGFAPALVEVDIAPSQVMDFPVVLRPGAGPVVGPGPGPGEVVVVRRRSNVPAFVLFGVAGAGLVAGGVLGGLALGAKSDFNNTAHPTLDQYNKVHSLAMGSDISIGIAAAAAIVGVVLIATNPAQPQQVGSSLFVTPYAGPTGGGAVAGLKF